MDFWLNVNGLVTLARHELGMPPLCFAADPMAPGTMPRDTSLKKQTGPQCGPVWPS
jgi:hypothetical protein